MECSNCYIKKTCQWRRGLNSSILCNACGVYFNRNKKNKKINILKNDRYYANILIEIKNSYKSYAINS